MLNCGVGDLLLRVPWTVRRSSQSILKEISPEYSLEGLRLKLTLQYFDHLMQKTEKMQRTGKDSDAGKDWRQKDKGATEDEIVRWNHQLNGQSSSGSRSWWWTGNPGVLQSMGSWRVGHDWVNWTELYCFYHTHHCNHHVLLGLPIACSTSEAPLYYPVSTFGLL